MIVNCNDLWTRFVHVVYRVTRRPVLTPEPPRASPSKGRGGN
jgi:hypothetical protein